jgi:hypothetical protein
MKMPNATELLRQNKRAQIWEKYCGFLDLSIEEFLKIQNSLLLAQIERLAKCEIGRKLFGLDVPATVEKFREITPITTYSDYEEFLLEQNEDALPEKPYVWAHTSGRGGEYRYKWIPYTKKMYDICGESALASFIMSACKKRGMWGLRKAIPHCTPLLRLPTCQGFFWNPLRMSLPSGFSRHQKSPLRWTFRNG